MACKCSTKSTKSNTGAPARPSARVQIPTDMQPWIGRQYTWADRGLDAISRPEAGRIYLGVNLPAEGLQPILVEQVAPDRLVVRWLGGSANGRRSEIFGGHVYQPRRIRSQQLELVATNRQQSLFTGAPPEVLSAWRKALTQYVSAVKAKRSRSALASEFWFKTSELFQAWGFSWQAFDPASPEAIAWVDAQWAGLVVDLAGAQDEITLVTTLASAARGAASNVNSAAKKGPLTWEQASPVLLLSLRAIQVGEHMVPSVQPGTRKGDPCKPPKGRKGANAACHGDWDSVTSCIIRSGGLNSKDPAVAELVHAAGDRRHLPPRLISRKGKPWSTLAHVLTEQGFVYPDGHGRPDERQALEYLVNALRGGAAHAINTPYQCAVNRQHAEDLETEAHRVEGPRPARRSVSKARHRASRLTDKQLSQVVAQALGGLPPGRYNLKIKR